MSLEASPKVNMSSPLIRYCFLRSKDDSIGWRHYSIPSRREQEEDGPREEEKFAILFGVFYNSLTKEYPFWEGLMEF